MDPAAGAPAPDDAELEAFADGLHTLLRQDLRERPLPPGLALRLRRMTHEYETDEARAWPFFVGVGVVILGLAGAALWTPLILGGIAVLAVAAGVADQLLRRLAHRTLAEVARKALGPGRG